MNDTNPVQTNISAARQLLADYPSITKGVRVATVVGSALRHANPRDVDLFLISDTPSDVNANHVFSELHGEGCPCSNVALIAPLGLHRFKLTRQGIEFSLHFAETGVLEHLSDLIQDVSHYVNTDLFAFTLAPQVVYRFWILETCPVVKRDRWFSILQTRVHPDRAPWVDIERELAMALARSVDYLSRHVWHAGMGLGFKLGEMANYLVLYAYAKMRRYAGTARTIDNDLATGGASVRISALARTAMSLAYTFKERRELLDLLAAIRQEII